MSGSQVAGLAGRGRAAVLTACFAVAGVTGCAGSDPTTAGSAGTAPTAGSKVGSSTTAGGRLPTVFDCGAGAFEPATLIVVCATNATTVTDAKWTSWTADRAAGSGVVHPHGAPGGPAALTLSKVVDTPGGPQFSMLTVDWSGPSPDGKPSEAYPLAVAS